MRQRVTRAVLLAVVGAAVGAAIARALRQRMKVPALPVKRLERSARMAALSTRAAADLAVVKARQAVTSNEDQRQALEDDFHERTAAQAVAAMGEMKGALMKLGQMVSFVDSGLPDMYRDALASLQADAPPMDADDVARVITDEFGRGPDELFATFEPVPLAAASIGQVHAATLRDGRYVVVKVQYPGVAEAIAADLENADLLVNIMRMVFPNLDPEPMVEELKARIGEELDYRREQANLDAFLAIYRGHPYFKIPEVYPEKSTSRVITMERLHGRRWSDALEASDELRQQWAEAIYRFVFGSLSEHLMFNGDPHPGNYLFCDDGSVAFLDFGCVKHFTPELRTISLRLNRSVLGNDAAELRRSLLDLGFLTRDDEMPPERDLEWFRNWFAPLCASGPWTYTKEWAAEALRINFDPMSEWGDVQRRYNQPADYLFLNRINLGLNSILAGLGARNVWGEIIEEYWVGAPPVTPMGQAHARFKDASRS